MIDYTTELETLSGQTSSLEPYRGTVLLIVNTASLCGLTPQYEGLERLYGSYGEKGLSILGFPCNQFGNQEPDGSDSIASFCQVNYGVTFPMFAKIKVNGSKTHPLFKYLKSEATGLLGSEAIKWNFTKFLVDRDGKVVRRYAPQVEPDDIKDGIEALL
jgi:glutathione peroxidase